MYDSDTNLLKPKKNDQWNNFWTQVNLLLNDECLLNDVNSFQFKSNLENELSLEKNNKQYMTRMNLFISNSNSDISNKLTNLQQTLKSNIEIFFNIKNISKRKILMKEKK